ncbi:MAG TPA: 5-formyltetrahydrofolate cyclo-ligase [Thermoanaerobaculia bacterium]|jgi:5-formyltetrahydrofolate cyclo-ligase
MRSKPELRVELAARLAALDPAAARAAADRVAERALATAELRFARRVMTCLSFGCELDTWRLVARLLASGRELYVPRADRRDGELHVHRYPCPLETLEFGLSQPSREALELAPSAVDRTVEVVLVLGVGFDRRGYRLGHGRGYFDRFLAGRRFPALGLAFDEQLVDALPVAPHDVPMRLVVTPTETLRPQRD